MGTSADMIREALENAAILYDLPEGSRVDVETNRDGTVDATLHFPIPRGQQLTELLQKVEQAIRDAPMPKRYFVSAGFLFQVNQEAQESSTDFTRIMGKYRKQTYYYPDLPRAVDVIERIEGNFRRRRFRKPDEGFVAIHWNRYGAKPPKPEGTSKRRR